jgi:DNA-binding MurR/RpiR family transcriptional regulator
VQPSIAEMIADRADQMTAGERRAAQTLIASYPVVGLKTVAEFSQQAGVSSPTILRFVARLGFQNYADFQSRLQDELAAQLQSPLSRAGRVSSQPSPEAPASIEATLENIRETFRHISAKQLKELVELLSAGRKVVLVGGRFTDPIARYMAAHLTLVRPNIFHLGGQDSNWRDSLVDMNKRDVLLIFDIRRYQDSVARFAEKAAARGIQIVLVTDQWLSPIARFARHVVAARTAVPSPWDSSAALMVVAEVLISEITRHTETESSRRMSAIDDLR